MPGLIQPSSASPPPSTADRDELLRVVRQRLIAATAARSIAKGGALIALVGAIYAATYAAICFTEFWLLKIVLGYANGLAIGMLFLIGHDACHMGLTPVGWLNRLLGRIAFLPALHPYSSWELSHNGLHHGWTNLKGRDPGYSPLSKEEFDRLPAWRRTLQRIYRTSFGLTLYYLIENWVRVEMFPNAEHRARFRNPRQFQVDRVIVAAFALAMIGLSIGLGILMRPAGQAAWIAGLGHFAVAWVLPFLIWNGFISFITFQQHTHPRIRWFDNEPEWTFYDTQVRGTVHIEFPWILRMLLHNINEHTAHHINPRVPLYELKSAQAGVREVLNGDVMVVRWSPRVMRDTLRRCKLYDFREHRWLDFDGRPTTESMKVAGA